MVESAQLGVYVCIFSLLALATVAIVLRFVARRLKGVWLWYDDYLAVFAYISALVYDGFSLWLIRFGLGLHLEDLPVTIVEANYYQAMVQEVQEHTYTFGIGGAQLSLLALYWRLFQDITGPRIAIYILSGCIIIWLIIRLFMSVFQCYPPKYHWDKTVNGVCTIDPGKYFIGTVLTHLLIDVALIAIPASQISRLRLPWVHKAAIMVMFMFGAVACIASIMMMVVSSRFKQSSNDIMWIFAPLVNWSAAEIHLSIVACCLPLLRPVARAVGVWFTDTFSRGTSNNFNSTHSLRLGSIRRTIGRIPNRLVVGESTLNLASSMKSNIEVNCTDETHEAQEAQDSTTTARRFSNDRDSHNSGAGNPPVVVIHHPTAR